MFMAQARVDDVKCFFTAFEAFLYKREQHAILFVRAVEERADVPVGPQRRAGETNRLFADWASWGGRFVFMVCWKFRYVRSHPVSIFHGLTLAMDAPWYAALRACSSR